MRGRPDFPIDGIMPPDPVTPREAAELMARFTGARRVQPHEMGTRGLEHGNIEIVAIDRTDRIDLNKLPPFMGAQATRRWGNGNPYYAACTDCGGSIHWLDAPTGGWWAHDRHPDDGHDAVPPRRTHDSRGECICQAIGNPPCHWCSTTCCAEHIDHCLAGFPVPCCERCPDVE